ncbi:hypothetical protein M7I_4023 [Glarea lozoyensis 74030]|uniref:Uncharacterized protein n=1 Tax=Glarea lozoyensis (strain ATCC 74030 / MF5533) TaxID=1104152 RepID=H0EN23_GLAL7|nr:hypothetical protein M7I_4023 [Glarea lozoyensis 74030]
MSSYVVPQSRYYTLGSFSEYPEENVNVDYGVQNPSYSLLGNEQFIPPTYPSSSRGWTPAPQAAKATPMYLEQDPGYGGQVSYNSAYQLRPTISPEPKSAVHATSIPIAVTAYGTSSEKRESHNQDSLSPEETIASLSDPRTLGVSQP